MRADAARNRAAILEAADEILSGGGPEISTEDVARRASVGSGTVFRHFPTKEALLRAIVVRRLDRLTDEAEALECADDAEALFAFLDQVVRDSARKRSLVNAMTALGMDVEELMQEAGAGFRTAVCRLLARAQEAGAVRGDIDASDVLDLLLALAHTVDPAAFASGEAPRAVAIVFDGLKLRGGKTGLPG